MQAAVTSDDVRGFRPSEACTRGRRQLFRPLPSDRSTAHFTLEIGFWGVLAETSGVRCAGVGRRCARRRRAVRVGGGIETQIVTPRTRLSSARGRGAVLSNRRAARRCGRVARSLSMLQSILPRVERGSWRAIPTPAFRRWSAAEMPAFPLSLWALTRPVGGLPHASISPLECGRNASVPPAACPAALATGFAAGVAEGPTQGLCGRDCGGVQSRPVAAQSGARRPPTCIVRAGDARIRL